MTKPSYRFPLPAFVKSETIIDRIVETTDRTNAAIMADRKLSIMSPGTTKVASQRTIALTTKVNIPRVKKFKGAVKKSRIGLMKVLISPRIIAVMNATLKSEMWKP